MKGNKEQKKSSSPLIEKVNYLQAKYQTGIQGLSEEKKDEARYTELFGELYDALSAYIEYSVDQCLCSYKSGAKAGDLDEQWVKEKALDEVFGLSGKVPLYENFQSENGAKFTTYCYGVIENIVKDAVRKEKNRLLRQMCLNKSELEEMRQWNLHGIAKQLSAFEELEESIVDRIYKNPQKVYEEQCYLQECIGKLKDHMDIVAEGPELKQRSSSNKPVYRWVGGSVGAYLSPVAKSEWQDMNWETDRVYKTVSLVQETAFWVASHQAAETLRMLQEEKTPEMAGRSQMEITVREKLTEQMELALKPVKIKEAAGIRQAGTSKNEYRKLVQKYYAVLESKYRADISADAEFALTWTWQVIHGLTARETAWLFERELGVCVPVLGFEWKGPFKETLKSEEYSLLFETVTTEKTTQKWPKEIRNKVFEIQRAREKQDYEYLLEEIKQEARSIDSLAKKGAVGLDGLQ